MQFCRSYRIVDRLPMWRGSGTHSFFWEEPPAPAVVFRGYETSLIGWKKHTGRRAPRTCLILHGENQTRWPGRAISAAQAGAGIAIALKGRGSEREVDDGSARIAHHVAEEIRCQALITTHQVGSEVLKSLRQTDAMAYLRYASVSKRYRSIR